MRIKYFLYLFCLGLICLAINTQASSPAWKRCHYSAHAIQMLAEVLEEYKKDKGSYPNTEEGIGSLVKENYLVIHPQDAWGRDFKYLYQKNGDFKITTLGRDGKKGGDGFDVDYSWKDNVDAYIEECKKDRWFFWLA